MIILQIGVVYGIAAAFVAAVVWHWLSFALGYAVWEELRGRLRNGSLC